MPLTVTEKRERAERHVLFIEQQIGMLEKALTPESRAEREFQWWRQGLLRKYAAAADACLEARLEDLERLARPETWAIRHRMSRTHARGEDEWRSVCEAVIIEYLLGLYPCGGEA